MPKCPHACLLCYSGAKHRSYHGGHFNDRFLKKRKPEMAARKLHKPTSPAPADAPPVPFKDLLFEEDYPCLYSLLVEDRWADGSPRRTSTLLFFVEEGSIKACLNDRDLKQSAFFAGESFNKLLAIIETKLCDDSADWRRHKQQ